MLLQDHPQLGITIAVKERSYGLGELEHIYTTKPKIYAFESQRRHNVSLNSTIGW